MARGNNAVLGSAGAHINHNHLHNTASRQPYQSNRFRFLGVTGYQISKTKMERLGRLANVDQNTSIVLALENGDGCAKLVSRTGSDDACWDHFGSPARPSKTSFTFRKRRHHRVGKTTLPGSAPRPITKHLIADNRRAE